jgi:hypothetical protein
VASIRGEVPARAAPCHAGQQLYAGVLACNVEKRCTSPRVAAINEARAIHGQGMEIEWDC